jgi:hypothetical protein
MQHDFFQMFETQLRELGAKIDAERHALASLEDREEAGVKRHQIAVLEALVIATTDARDKICVAEMNAAASIEKYRKWRGLVLAARTARDAFDLAGKPIERAQVDCDNAEAAYFKAARELSRFTENVLDGYATEPEKNKWGRRRAELESVVNHKSSELRMLKQKLEGFRAEWMRARDAFGKAEFSERMARLPAQNQRPQIRGSVSNVA